MSYKSETIASGLRLQGEKSLMANVVVLLFALPEQC